MKVVVVVEIFIDLKNTKKNWSEDEKKEKAAARQDGEKVQREPLKLRRVEWYRWRWCWIGIEDNM